MVQAKIIGAVERVTVYVTCQNSKSQQNVKIGENKRIEIFNKGGNTFIRDG